MSQTRYAKPEQDHKDDHGSPLKWEDMIKKDEKGPDSKTRATDGECWKIGYVT